MGKTETCFIFVALGIASGNEVAGKEEEKAAQMGQKPGFVQKFLR